MLNHLNMLALIHRFSAVCVKAIVDHVFEYECPLWHAHALRCPYDAVRVRIHVPTFVGQLRVLLINFLFPVWSQGRLQEVLLKCCVPSKCILFAWSFVQQHFPPVSQQVGLPPNHNLRRRPHNIVTWYVRHACASTTQVSDAKYSISARM